MVQSSAPQPGGCALRIKLRSTARRDNRRFAG